ncbi:MAG: hypothetical protein UIB61_05075 [Treponema sp.]|nr:hypothetical protein [Treponema sp.]
MKLFKSKKIPAYFQGETVSLNKEEILDAAKAFTPEALHLCAAAYLVVMSKLGVTPKEILEILET